MSKHKDDGGPAFPSEFHSNGSCEMYAIDGMSLRDWFAGQALNYLADPNVGLKRPEDYTSIARTCYGVADAMLEAKKQ